MVYNKTGGLATPASVGVSAAKVASNAASEVAMQTRMAATDCYRQCVKNVKDAAMNLNNQANKYAIDTINDTSYKINANINNSKLGGKKRRSMRNIKRTRKYKRGSNKKRIQKRRKITRKI